MAPRSSPRELVATFVVIVGLALVVGCRAHGGHRHHDHHDHHGQHSGHGAHERRGAPTRGDLVDAVLASTLVSLASLAACSLLAMRAIGVRVSARWLNDVSVGAILGDAVAHQLPATFDAARGLEGGLGGENGNAFAAMSVVFGALAFHEIEKAVRWTKRRERSRAPGRSRSRSRSTRGRGKTKRGVTANLDAIATSGWLNLFADAMHNFTDGVVIALAFARRGRSAGWATTWAALAHELPQEVGDYGVLRLAGFTDAQALLFNLASALVAVLAVLATFVFLAASAAAESSAPAFAAAVVFAEAASAGGFLAVAFSGLADIARHDAADDRAARAPPRPLSALSVALGALLVARG
jgi:zinc transporter 7